MIHSNAIQNTSYSGLVKLSTRTKGVVNSVSVHNAGTRLFMDRIAQIVCGYDVDIVPQFINIVSSETSYLISPVRVEGKVWGQPADPSLDATSLRSVALCNAVITDFDIDKSKQIPAKGSLTMQLMTINKEILATISSEDVRKMLTEISPSTDGLVSWSLSFNAANDKPAV